jgi:esterase
VATLFHTDLGGAGKTPMLLLHGLLGSSRNWQSTGRDLAQHFHVMALDARNHGKSSHEDEMSYSAMADDLAAWMDAQGLAKAVIVGHSMGGKAAMRFACRFPERVERLVVVDIAPKDYHWVAHRAEFSAMNELDLVNLSSRQEAETRFEAHVPELGMRKFLTTNLERTDAGGWRWMVNLPVLTDALSEMEKNSLTPEDRFSGPTLFIAGGCSQYIQSRDHAAILEHFPNAKIAVIATSGHNPHMDSRAEFVSLVLGSA